MQLSDIIPSRFYSFVYDSEVKLLKGGKAGVAPNPLYGHVSKRAVYAGQAASGQMYVNAVKKVNPNWQPSTDYTPRWQDTENDCVVQSIPTGSLQVRIINPRTVKCEYRVDNRPATSEELELIKLYKPARKPNPLAVKVMFPYVENLTNVNIDEIPEVLTDED